eukprot:8396882-Pyramimonas_sp.AAC.1
MVRHLWATASRGMTIWKLDPEAMAFASFSDAGGVGAREGQQGAKGLPEGPTRDAWMILATDRSVIDNRAVGASILAW